MLFRRVIASQEHLNLVSMFSVTIKSRENKSMFAQEKTQVNFLREAG